MKYFFILIYSLAMQRHHS